MQIGDRVERLNPGKRKHSAGRVTGFAPNGWMRVLTDTGARRIWPREKLKLVGPTPQEKEAEQIWLRHDRLARDVAEFLSQARTLPWRPEKFALGLQRDRAAIEAKYGPRAPR